MINKSDKKSSNNTQNEKDFNLYRYIGGTCLFGFSVVAVFVMGSIVWSSLAPISGAVIASGAVSVEGSRKTVQHLEGGIISTILVKDGDHVNAGEILIVLDETRVLSRVEDLLNRVRTLAAREARLKAERSESEQIIFDHVLLKDASNPEVKAILDQQISQMETRKDNISNSLGILVKRIAQLKQQTAGVERQITGVREQLRLIREEVETVSEMLTRGYDTKPRLLALQRVEADLVAREGELLSDIARNQEAIGETELRKISLRTEHVEEVDGLLSLAQAERTSTEKIYWESVDELKRTSVISPVDGVVMNMAFTTVGGVLRSGEPILEIVPDEDNLIVNVRVRPQDIDEISLHITAQVIFPSYVQRNMHRIAGELIHISADTIVDDKNNEVYFLAKVKVDTNDLENQIQDVKLVPGMPADVYLKTSDRSLFNYLFQPVARTYERALRET